MTHNEYIEIFTAFAEDSFLSHKPQRAPGTSPGSFSGLQSYITDYQKQLESLNELLVNKANEIVGEADNNDSIDKASLKDELQKLGVQLIKGYMSKNKPQ